MLKFVLNDGSTERDMTSDELLRELGEFTGYRPVGISPDGSVGIYETPQGLQKIPFYEAIRKVGGKIVSYEPEAPIPAKNMTTYRMSLGSVSDPNMRKTYLETVAKNDFGETNPQIIGTKDGDFLWSNKMGKWVALTNEKGLDASDIMSGAAGLGEGVVSVAGGALGGLGAGLLAAPTGPLGIAAAIGGTAAGSAIGSGIAQSGRAAIMSGLDPNLRQAIGGVGNYVSKEGGNIAKNAAITGAINTALPFAGRVLGFAGKRVTAPLSVAQNYKDTAKTIGNTILNEGSAFSPISNATVRAGQGIATAGEGVKAVGKGLDSTLGRVGMQVGLDPTGISGVGALGQFVGDMAAPVAQAGAKARDFIHKGLSSLQGEKFNPIAGKTWQETAENIPGVANFVRGTEAFGRGLGKIGAGVESGIAGTVKGVGSGIKGAGLLTKGAGRVGQSLERPAYVEAARNALDPDYGKIMNEKGAGEIMMTNQEPSRNYRPYVDLFEAARASGGLHRFF